MPKMRRCSPEIPNMPIYSHKPSSLVHRCLAQSVRRSVWAGFIAFGALVGLIHSNCAIGDEIRPTGANVYQQVTGDDSEDDRKRWDVLYSTRTYVFGKEPAAFLRDHIHMLPVGRALDIAMGEGRNAVYLAKKGFNVDGIDISEVALKKAKRLARENRVSITTINADLSAYIIKPESYDVIVTIDFLLRPLVAQIKRGLKKGGIVVFENHTIDQLGNKKGQQIRRDFLLGRGELKELFSDFTILVYRETNDGKDARASLIARKP
jgi:tellurite methyltransferase